MDAVEAWNKAPFHIKTMAGDYVGPILAALVAIADEVRELKGEKNAANHG